MPPLEITKSPTADATSFAASHSPEASLAPDAGFAAKPNDGSGLATPRTNSRKRTYRYTFLSMRTLRFLLIHVPGRLVRPQGRNELRIAAAPAARKTIEKVLNPLAA